MTSALPYREGPPSPELFAHPRVHAVGRRDALLRPARSDALDEEVTRLRAELDRLDPATIQATRGAAGELALRASAALAVSTGSRSLLLSEHAQRLAREALFGLVYALRPVSREALLAQLRAD